MLTWKLEISLGPTLKKYRQLRNEEREKQRINNLKKGSEFERERRKVIMGGREKGRNDVIIF